MISYNIGTGWLSYKRDMTGITHVSYIIVHDTFATLLIGALGYCGPVNRYFLMYTCLAYTIAFLVFDNILIRHTIRIEFLVASNAYVLIYAFPSDSIAYAFRFYALFDTKVITFHSVLHIVFNSVLAP
jgi:hypothetical protein